MEENEEKKTVDVIYTGIGSRNTPEEYLQIFVELAQRLGKRGFTLRSGGADGADSAFEKGCDLVGGKKEIYLPWRNFNGNKSPYTEPHGLGLEFASKFHPAWGRCSIPARLLHGRNTHQILGYYCDTPTSFVVCWSLPTGGTQQALRIAKYYKIPIFNLREDMKEFIEFYKDLINIYPLLK